jgi:arginyl-tRNA synthetase
MPQEIGVGITSFQPLPNYLVNGMRYEKTGIYHNYFFTKENFTFPKIDSENKNIITIDGFSPNLNKVLHVGHIRNIVLANSLTKLLNANPVALLGASLGVLKNAQPNFEKLCKTLGYFPIIYYDVLMPVDVLNDEEFENIPTDIDIVDGEKDLRGTTIWKGPKGPVIVKKSNGNKTYAYWDLVFAKTVSPDYYITGAEQKEHFESLGLGNKHLPMGLILGIDGKKLKSRTGDALSLDDALEMIVSSLKETKEGTDREKLAWNVLIWNLLSVSREKNIKFNPEEWTKIDSGGMYVSYTYARAKSALTKAYKTKRNDNNPDFTELDISLLGNANYYTYFFDQSKKKLDPSPLAHFVFDLSKKINEAYESERLAEGRQSFCSAFSHATCVLEKTMELLGMFQQESI